MSAPRARYGRGTVATNRLVRQMLGEMADRLEAERPDEPVTPTSRIAIIQATTMDHVLGRALRERAPEITGPTARRDYAVQLRKIAEAM
jgi:hypothetical protein